MNSASSVHDAFSSLLRKYAAMKRSPSDRAVPYIGVGVHGTRRMRFRKKQSCWTPDRDCLQGSGRLQGTSTKSSRCHRM